MAGVRSTATGTPEPPPAGRSARRRGPGVPAGGSAARRAAVLAGLWCALAGAALLMVFVAGGASALDPGRRLLAIGLVASSAILPIAGLIRASRSRT